MQALFCYINRYPASQAAAHVSAKKASFPPTTSPSSPSAVFQVTHSKIRFYTPIQTSKAQSAGGKCRRCFAISHRHLLPKPQRISWQSRLLPHYISFVAQHRLSGRAFQKFAFIYHSNLESAICSQAMWVSFASAFNPFHSYSIVPRQSSLSRRFLCSD